MVECLLTIGKDCCIEMPFCTKSEQGQLITREFVSDQQILLHCENVGKRTVVPVVRSLFFWYVWTAFRLKQHTS